MDFLLKTKINSNEPTKIQACNSIIGLTIEDNVLYYEQLNHLDYVESSDREGKLLLLGDVIRLDTSRYKGLHYSISIGFNNIISIQSDSHCLLPLYYMIIDNHYYISSSFRALSEHIKVKTVNTNFFIDLSLLYSNMGDDTHLKEIKRIRYGDKIVIDKILNIVNTGRFYDNFIDSPTTIKKSTEHISDAFIKNCKEYVKNPCAISLTGGFDGRVITACAHFFDSDFISFSFGRNGNGDVENPLFISKQLELDYHLVELAEDYIEKDFVMTSLNSLSLSGGLTGFQSTHSLYYVKKIGEIRDIIVTGYLGSEILANPKRGNDEVVSQSVIDYLLNGENDSNFAFKNIGLLKQLEIINDKQDILASLTRLDDYFKELPYGLSKNQMLIAYNFENIVRNTFGAWVYNGMHYAKIRVPFLDKDFFEEIARTQLSSFYRKFLEGNIYKRINGQVLYPNILKKTWPELNQIVSSKGYAPSDIMTIHGIIKIAYRKLLKINPYCDIHHDNRSRISGALRFLDSAENTFSLEYDEALRKYLQADLISQSLCLKSLSGKLYKQTMDN